jgi:molybdate/tungstate transport system substrate-binding protein
LHAKKVVLKVFHAGSLSVPFSKIEKAFEKRYPYIDVRREASGSVQAIRKIIDLHKPCDVVAVADYTLIPKMLFPAYTNYVKLFARNELVLCYTKYSKYAKVINSKNWYEILNKKEVKWGFSNPNDDPCGYRTVIAIGLASLYYKNPLILKNLLGKNTNLKWKKKENGIIFYVPKDLKFNTEKLAIRPKSVELLGLLETGAIDYAFEYKSVALQHNLLFIKLPEKFNLSTVKYRNFYRMCKIKLANGKIIPGKPIVYGITVLKNAPHPEEAKLWENFVTSKEGKRLLLNSYQTPIFPAKIIKAK